MIQIKRVIIGELYNNTYTAPLFLSHGKILEALTIAFIQSVEFLNIFLNDVGDHVAASHLKGHLTVFVIWILQRIA